VNVSIALEFFFFTRDPNWIDFHYQDNGNIWHRLEFRVFQSS
jgi:hypothetical protein